MFQIHLITHRRGFSMIGMLITMACMVVLFTILMTSMNRAVTGEGSQKEGTVRSFEDKLYLTALYQGLAVYATENKGQYFVPSRISGSNDRAEDTTANLFSSMVMLKFVERKQLVSGNEYSGYVDVMENYDFAAYDPAEGVFWDPKFKADLHRLSHVSFAHMPLYGQRFERQWKSSTMDSTVALVGNRGPKDGVSSKDSMACGKDGVWRGHIVFGDGHVDFLENPAPASMTFELKGDRYADNLFIMDAGPEGGDAILAFTKAMSKNGPELQFD